MLAGQIYKSGGSYCATCGVYLIEKKDFIKNKKGARCHRECGMPVRNRARFHNNKKRKIENEKKRASR